MSLAGDIIDRAGPMSSDRINWVNVWIDIAEALVLPKIVGNVFFLHDVWRA